MKLFRTSLVTIGLVAAALPLHLKAQELALQVQEQVDAARKVAEDARAQADQIRAQVKAMNVQIDMRGLRDDRSDRGYQEGTRALDRRDYEGAVKNFDRVITQKSSRAEGAYYWKAYALNKMGKRAEALASLAEISKQFPQSRWLNDARALEAEVKQANGQPVSPEGQSDEELKIYAINALINSDPERAIPLLEKLLSEAKTAPRLKEKALFVLAQSRSEKARATVSQYAKNGSNPDLQLHAVEYLGMFRTKDSQQTLAGIYSSTTDVNIKRAVLHGFMNARDMEHLLAAAKTETNPELRREAINGLSGMQASSELEQLYASETTYEWKNTILRSMHGSQHKAKLLEIAKSEKDSRLRMTAIRNLGSVRKDKTADDLVPLYTAESDKAVKTAILDAMAQQNSAKQIVDAARKESDPEMKRQAVERLSRMKSKEATDFLVELLNK